MFTHRQTILALRRFWAILRSGNWRLFSHKATRLWVRFQTLQSRAWGSEHSFEPRSSLIHRPNGARLAIIPIVHRLTVGFASRESRWTAFSSFGTAKWLYWNLIEKFLGETQTRLSRLKSNLVIRLIWEGVDLGAKLVDSPFKEGPQNEPLRELCAHS